MFLSRFGVTNYKCVGEIDIPLTPVHVLIGPNDAGKTSLMEAIAVLYGGLKNSIGELFPQPWQGRQLLSFGARENRIELRGQWLPESGEKADSHQNGGIAYGFSVLFQESGATCVKEPAWLNPLPWDLKGYENPDDRLPLDVSQGAPSERRVAFTFLQEDKAKLNGLRIQGLEDLQDFLKPIEKYSLDPRAMKLPAPLDPQRRFRLDHDGFGLATLLDDILGFDSALFKKVEDEFCKTYFKQFTAIRLKTENVASYPNAGPGSGTLDQAGKGIYLVSQGQEVRAQQVSDGAIIFLGILALAHLPEPPPLLLIEEPENGIYPKRLEEVVRLLKQLVERTDRGPFPQIILSTHSPYVLSFFEPEEVTFLSRTPGKADAPVRARPLRDAPHIRERLGKEFYLGELWYNLSEEDLFDGK